ncbi:hypothetical protein AS160_00205 [Marinitoga sp. 38H-ov]|nr:hypothetical protein AS160_00205 [Marinitoga sp. 38H-ov]
MNTTVKKRINNLIILILIIVKISFSRATQKELPSDFWEKNYKVMKAFYKLIDKTEEVLWLLNSFKD